MAVYGEDGNCSWDAFWTWGTFVHAAILWTIVFFTVHFVLRQNDVAIDKKVIISTIVVLASLFVRCVLVSICGFVSA